VKVYSPAPDVEPAVEKMRASHHEELDGVCSECAHRMLQAMLMPPETSEHWPRPSDELRRKR
jgi:hypothetical protein